MEADENNAIQWTDNTSCWDICNFFWRLQLCGVEYKDGDNVISFASLWPNSETLLSFLDNTTTTDDDIRDLCLIALRCGPPNIVSCLLEAKLIPNHQQQLFGDYNFTMLHVATLAGNIPMINWLSKNYPNMTRTKDELGRLPEEITHTPLNGKNNTGNNKKRSRTNSTSRAPSDEEIQELFQWAADPSCYDKLLLKMQLIDFDVNGIRNDHGDLMLHVAVGQGLRLIPFIMALINLHHASVASVNSMGLTPLCVAANSTHAVLVDILMCVFGANPNLCNPQTGWTPLHFAANKNDDVTADYLIKRGADVSLEDKEERRADELASRNEMCYLRLKSERRNHTEELISKIIQDTLKSDELKTSDLCLTDEDECTLLMVAAKSNSCQAIKLLTQYSNCPIDAQDGKGLKTALAFAVIEGHTEAVRLLLQNNCQVRIADVTGLLPLHYAVYNGFTDIVTLLLSSNDRLVGLGKARELSQSNDISQLISEAQNRRWMQVVKPAIFDCCMTGDGDKLFTLLEDGDNINYYTSMSDNPVFVAAHNGYTNVVKILLDYGAEARCREPATDNTLLHIASQEGHKSLVEFLIPYTKRSKKKPRVPVIDINALNGTGFTALQLAADKGNRDVVKILLDNNASTALLDVDRNLYSCKFDGLQVLIDDNRRKRMELFKSFFKDKKGLLKLRAEWLKPFDYELRDENGDTLLMCAAYAGRLDFITFLLEPITSIRSVLNSGTQTPYSESQISWPGTPGSSYTTASGSPSTPTAATPMTPRSPDSTRRYISGKNVMSVAGSPGTPTAITPRTPRSPESMRRHINGKSMISSYFSKKLIPSVAVDDVNVEYLKGVSTTDDKDASGGSPPTRRKLSFNRLDSVFSCWSLDGSVESYLEGQLFDARLLPNSDCVCNINSRDGYTALHRAVQGSDNNVSIVKALVNANIDCLNKQESTGCTALHLACQLSRKHIVKALLNFSDLDVGVVNHDGYLADELTKSSTIKKLIKNFRDVQERTIKSLHNFVEIQSVSSEGSKIDFERIGQQLTKYRNEVKDEEDP